MTFAIFIRENEAFQTKRSINLKSQGDFWHCSSRARQCSDKLGDQNEREYRSLKFYFPIELTVTEQDKIIAAYKEEVHQLKEARWKEKKGFQSLTADFVQAIKYECQWMLSLQHSDINFMPIHKISLRDLNKVIQKEKALTTVRESHSSV